MKIVEVTTNPNWQALSGNSNEILESYLPQIDIALSKYVEGQRIYRGVKTKEDIIYSYRKVERKAANTTNYVNLLVSNLPNWKAFPPRNRSQICSGSYSYASSYAYGDVYVVLPFDNARIGICPSTDFFDFGRLDVPHINRFLVRLYLLATKKELPQEKEPFFAALAELDTILTKDKIIEYMNADLDRDEFLLVQRTFIKYSKQFLKDQSFSENLEEWMDPDRNDFRVTTMSAYKSTPNEVWTDAPILLVREKILVAYLDSKSS